MSERENWTDYTDALNEDLIRALGMQHTAEASEEETRSELTDQPEKEEHEEEYDVPEFEYLTSQMDTVKPKKKHNTGKNKQKSTQRTKHASPWKEAAVTQNLNQGREKPTPKRSRHKDSGNMRFIIMTICIVIGVLAAAGALIYISLLFLY